MLRWGLHPQKRRLGFELALSGHHFIRYARRSPSLWKLKAAGQFSSRGPDLFLKSDGQARNLVQVNRVPGHS